MRLLARLLLALVSGQRGLYYYYHLREVSGRARQGDGGHRAGDRRWARDLWDALAARQRPDGSFVNQADGRHREQDPVLCTAYALNAMSDARPFVDAPIGPY